MKLDLIIHKETILPKPSVVDKKINDAIHKYSDSKAAGWGMGGMSGMSGIDRGFITFKNSIAAAIAEGASIDRAKGLHIAIGTMTKGVMPRDEDDIAENVIKTLIVQYNANVNIQDDDGSSPMHVAAAIGTTIGVRILKSFNGSIKLKTNGGDTRKNNKCIG